VKICVCSSSEHFGRCSPTIGLPSTPTPKYNVIILNPWCCIGNNIHVASTIRAVGADTRPGRIIVSENNNSTMILLLCTVRRPDDNSRWNFWNRVVHGPRTLTERSAHMSGTNNHPHNIIYCVRMPTGRRRYYRRFPVKLFLNKRIRWAAESDFYTYCGHRQIANYILLLCGTVTLCRLRSVRIF